MDVVDQSVYLGDVGKTYVDQLTIYSERTFLGLHPRRQHEVKVLQNFRDGDINICVDSAHPNRAVRARQPTGYCDRQMPRLTLCNRWRRRFLRRVVRLRSGEKNWREEENGRDEQLINDSAH